MLPSNADSVTLDQDALRLFYTDTCGEDAAFMQEMTALFLESVDRLVRDLEQAVKAGDAQLARRTVHTLKSSSLIFGAVSLAENCKQAEHLARENQMAAIPDLAAQIVRQARHLHAILPQEMERIAAQA